MQAERGLKELLESVDTMIVIPNEKLLAVAKDAGFFESFRIADDVLRQGVQGISDIITIPGIINRDFADVKTTMAGMGHAVMGTAVRSGANRAVEAAQAAMASPLLEAGAIDGARGILINITGSSTLKLSEVNEASSLIQSAAHEDANIIFGAVLDEKMGDEVKITVIATGFRDQMPERRARMLNVEEAPVVSVPVVAPGNWMREKEPEPEPGSKACALHERGRRGSGERGRCVLLCRGGAGRGYHGERGRAAEELPRTMQWILAWSRRAQSRRRSSGSTRWRGNRNTRPSAGTTPRISMKLHAAGRSRRSPAHSLSRRCFLNPAGSKSAISMFPRFCAGCSFRA